MKKVLLSCIALVAGAAMAIAQDEPVYPKTLDFTLNGEKELAGVSVSQTPVPYDGAECLTINITGECDANAITMNFVTPEGWDYALINSVIGGADTPFMTRSGNHWFPINKMESGYKKGNSFKFPVDGKESYGTIYLVNGENIWDISIDITFKVAPKTSAVESINSIDGNAEYYNLNGSKISKPSNGLYIKVADGKATKVVVK